MQVLLLATMSAPTLRHLVQEEQQGVLQNPPAQAKLEALIAQRVTAQSNLLQAIQERIAQQVLPSLQALPSGQALQKESAGAEQFEAPAEQQPEDDESCREEGELDPQGC